jgi:hypothetical protein
MADPSREPLTRRELRRLLEWADKRDMLCRPPHEASETISRLGTIATEHVTRETMGAIVRAGCGAQGDEVDRVVVRSGTTHFGACKLCLARRLQRAGVPLIARWLHHGGPEFEKNGAYNNASTSSYDISYEAECADFEWDRILGLLLTAITKPLFLKEEFEAEE